MLKPFYSAQFKRDYKVIQKRGYDTRLFEEVLRLLVKNEPLPAKYKEHALKGIYAGNKECHITPDWLLVYKVENDVLILTLTRTGTHSDLF